LLILWSIYNGFPQITEYLLDHGADPNSRTASHYAAIRGGSSALLIATRTGEIKVVELLLAHGAKPEVADVKGFTPLDIAQRFKFREIEALLKAPQVLPPSQ